MEVDEFLTLNPSGDEARIEGACSDEKILKQARDIRAKALALLSRREHSFQELASKLSRTFPDESMVLEQLQALADEGLQSNERYVDIAIRSGVAKFHGLSRIKNQLRNKGLSADLIEKAMAETDIDWFAQLKQLSNKKYGDTPCDDRKEKAKRIRFFQYRGYSLSDIYAVLDKG
ncbi:MAG: regulatory protein RecX [Pseudomonadales bacterium]|nr:regulatory protein RecX [Pseudomonadales bacterium]